MSIQVAFVIYKMQLHTSFEGPQFERGRKHKSWIGVPFIKSEKRPTKPLSK